jgi:hypothetical protein
MKNLESISRRRILAELIAESGEKAMGRNDGSCSSIEEHKASSSITERREEGKGVVVWDSLRAKESIILDNFGVFLSLR